MSSDAELLRRYVDERSEAAFAELVKLHVNLVYFAALRQVGGDAHCAQDIAQSVFTDLARKAPSLIGRATLTGWLHTSTRFAATKMRRADFSRQKRDHEAEFMHALLHDESASRTEWERLRPMIDEVIHELGERDREAVLLRFFEGRTFADIGATLALSEDAARMRVERALEKLRATLTRRGVASTTSALAMAFANQATAMAPVGLEAAVTSTALAGAAMSGVATGTATFLSMAKIPAAVAAVVLVGASGVFLLRQTQAEQTPDTPAKGPTAVQRVTQRIVSEQPGANAPVVARAPAPMKTEWKSAAELARAGKATPRAALETLMLALVESDVDTFLSTLTLGPRMREKVELQLSRLPEDSRAKHGPAEKLYALNAVERSAMFIPRVAAIRIVGETAIDPDGVALRVQLQEVGGGIHEEPIEFHRTADGWRWRPPEK